MNYFYFYVTVEMSISSYSTLFATLCTAILIQKNINIILKKFLLWPNYTNTEDIQNVNVAMDFQNTDNNGIKKVTHIALTGFLCDSTLLKDDTFETPVICIRQGCFALVIVFCSTVITFICENY